VTSEESSSTFSATARTTAFICEQTISTDRGNLIGKVSEATRSGGPFSFHSINLRRIALMFH